MVLAINLHCLRTHVFDQICIAGFTLAFMGGSKWRRGYVLPAVELMQHTNRKIRFSRLPDLHSSYIKYNFMEWMAIPKGSIWLPNNL